MEKPNKLVAGFANQWADTFYFASTAYMRKIIITGKRLAIGEKKYILRQCIFDRFDFFKVISISQDFRRIKIVRYLKLIENGLN